MDDFIPSIKVTFYITGDYFDLEEVTQRLGVIPTETRTKESFPTQALACTGWSLETKEENCCAVAILFERMSEVLNGKSEIIKTICDEYKLNASFVVVIHMQNGDGPEVVLPREAISFAASINAEIGFDLYCYE